MPYIVSLTMRASLEKYKRLTNRYRAEARRHRKTIRALEKDIVDMHESRRTSFERCAKCKSLHDTVCVCECGWVNSIPKDIFL